MINLTLVNESKKVSSADFEIIVEATKKYVDLVVKAWDLPEINVKSSSTRIDGDWNMCVVDRFANRAREATATGYHEIVNGVPIAYARTYTIKALGSYFKGVFSKTKNKQLLPPRIVAGVITTVLHETVEMITDPYIKKRAMDSKGRNWIVEIADHSMVNWVMTINGKDIICPDFTYPSFYDVNGKAPYSYRNAPIAPFTLNKGSYGYYEDASGKFIKIV
jgi:hypothetical protein